ncbi:DisA checkpoint controller nucleotide-binding [Halovenus aranensis]|uniref:Diadenylate cyclase n=1 Tax=Halovenus aranensis TaxID=890420 RepID=A0A1G8T3Q2_9EURY|nr:diadenylate cyclase DacZ [Halovenus aranensis]SDJ36093.1 DisA checkpoint controller nucleotide-binding [Halovenus aranensis]
MTGLGDFFDDLVEDIAAVLLFTQDNSTYGHFAEADVSTVVVASDNAVDADEFVSLPLEFTDVEGRIRFGLEGALDQEFVEEGDDVLCLTQSFDENDLDTIVRIRADEFTRTGLYDLFTNSRPDADVVQDVLEVAIELGKKGQKGKPVGALFVVGDAGKVMNKSRPLSYNPFEKSHVHVGDPIVNVMLKEFSRLDGAFVISDGGKIVSAYRYLEPDAEGIDIPKGLGTRHMAAAGTTRDTNAIAVVLSESDGMVRAFKAGEIVLELDPEEY